MSFHLFPFISETSVPTVEGLPTAPSPDFSASGSSEAVFKKLLARFSGQARTVSATDITLSQQPQEFPDTENAGLVHGVVTLERATFLTLVPNLPVSGQPQDAPAEQPVLMEAPPTEVSPTEVSPTEEVQPKAHRAPVLLTEPVVLFDGQSASPVPIPDASSPLPESGEDSAETTTAEGSKVVRQGPPQAVLPEATFPEATFPEATLPEATLPEATFPEATLPEATLPEATLPEATLPEATLPEATLPEAEEMPEPMPRVTAVSLEQLNTATDQTTGPAPLPLTMQVPVLSAPLPLPHDAAPQPASPGTEPTPAHMALPIPELEGAPVIELTSAQMTTPPPKLAWTPVAKASLPTAASLPTTPTLLPPTEDPVQTAAPLVKAAESFAPTHRPEQVDGGGPLVSQEAPPLQEHQPSPPKNLPQPSPKARTSASFSVSTPSDFFTNASASKPTTEQPLQGIEVKQMQVQPQKADEAAAWLALAEQGTRPASVSMSSFTKQEQPADPAAVPATPHQQQGTSSEGDTGTKQDTSPDQKEPATRLAETPEPPILPALNKPLTDTSSIPPVEPLLEEAILTEGVPEMMTQEEEAVFKPLEFALREILTRNTSQTTAPVFTQHKSATAWLRTFNSNPMLAYEQQDGWQMMEVKLDEANGTMTVRTKRDQDGLAVSVVFSDPHLRAQVAEHAERIRESLSEEYDTAIDLSFTNDEQDAPESNEPSSSTGATAQQQLTASGEHEVPESPGALRRAGARHVWIG